MDQVPSTMKTEMTVAFVGGTLTFVVAFHMLRRQQARRLLESTKRTMILAAEKQNDEDNGVVVYDCIVCLCDVSPRDECRVFPNCDHGVQFHAHCIDPWLKDHSTCPVCRSHIPRPLSQRLHNYLCDHFFEDVISYCNSALDNVASSIGDCHDF
ncbi:zinc finger, RING/FYVE/PHD-type [Artemisia annua]|uniref:Zinc finger, RING/FYVE/PHD-type n=1 Tax=Artemisia annua TaxID=35608 RepID=A0A2U1PGE8_ARTAN|nr:zinc finger, RING/FYVE/PHD-type [Artemisia annua]